MRISPRHTHLNGDQIRVTGSVAIANTSLTVTIGAPFVPTIGDVYTIIDNNGTDDVGGTFNGLPEGSSINLNGSVFRVSYRDGSEHNDVTLTSTVVAKTWTGAVSTLWSDADNWTGGVPDPGDPLIFPSVASNKASENDLEAGTVFGQIAFTGGGYTLTGNAIGLSGGVTDSSSGPNTIGLPIQLTASQTFQLSAATLSGGIDLQSNNLTVAIQPWKVVTISGPLTGSGVISKTTPFDLLVLNGSGTYSGTINGGSYVVINGELPYSSIIMRGDRQYLGGAGPIGPLSIQSGAGWSAFIAPGPGMPLSVPPDSSGPGILSTGDLTLSGSGGSVTYLVNLNGPDPGSGYDQIRVTGSVAIANTSPTVTIGEPFVPTIGDVYTIIDNNDVDEIEGTFLNLPEGSTVTTPDLNSFTLSYADGIDHNDVTLTALTGKQPTVTVASPAMSSYGTLPQQVVLGATVTSGGAPLNEA